MSCRFDQMFATVLEQLQPLCVAEQKFLTSFFHFQKPEKEEEEEQESAGSQVVVGGGEEHSSVPSPATPLSIPLCHPSLSQGDEEDPDQADFHFPRKAQPQLMDIHGVGGGLQGLLSQLFHFLLPEIEGLIQYGERLDSL